MLMIEHTFPDRPIYPTTTLIFDDEELMSSKLKKRPGTMGRATIAWFVLNGALLLTLALAVYVLKPFMEVWYVPLPLLVGFIITEWVITAETIAPIVRDWIKQEEYVADGHRASWEKDAT